ncbi:MAG: redox-regulated ATPase YchF [Clostridiales bacterium]
MKLGIVGLPNVGKSTLFNAITKAGAECANYPFCTIEPNVGVVHVPDNRLNILAKIYSPEKITPTTIEFTDIAGLVKGASKGEGLGNKFLSHIRQVDAIVHVVRCFEDENITHVDGSISPVRDISVIDTELMLSDLESIEKRIDKTKKTLKSGDKKFQIQLNILEKIKSNLDNGICIRNMDFNDDEMEYVKELFMLTSKPVIYVANISESEISSISENKLIKELEKFANGENSESLVVCAKIEEEIAQLNDDEKVEFLQELNLNESGLDRLIKSCYKLLGLISFLTAGPKEVRAWTIVNGLKAPQAAGKIHTDFEKGFIKAEIVSYDDLIKSNTYSTAKDNGLVRLEGKEYIVKDGDIILFRFNV